MKYLLLVLALSLSIAAVNADQRFESWQGICHFAYDPADDDNEVYFANCINSIKTHDSGDGNGRLAYGSALVSKMHAIANADYPTGGTQKLKGATANNMLFPDADYTTLNTNCVMVTSNYDNANDANNETEYQTTDWQLDITYSAYDIATRTFMVTYDLGCRKGVAN